VYVSLRREVASLTASTESYVLVLDYSQVRLSAP
jgi:hypothetical protein